MRIKMLTQLTGTRNGVRWPIAGTEIDLPTGEANDLVAAFLAKRVEEPVKPERAVGRKPETRKKG